MQRVENDVVFGNSARGLFLLTATGLSGERNIFPISGNIKEKLLSEEGLRDGFSINTGRGYLFCVNGSGYFWDYSLSPYKKSADLSKAENSLSWFLLSNLKANTLSVLSEECVGGDKDSFSLIFESGDHLDFGELIPGIYRSPLISGGDMARKKSVTMLSLSTETESHSEFSLCYLGDNVKIPGETVRTIKFSLYPMNLAAFSFAVPNHATVVCCRPNISDTNYFAFEIKATAPGAEISLLEASASLSLRGGRFGLCPGRRTRGCRAEISLLEASASLSLRGGRE